MRLSWKAILGVLCLQGCVQNFPEPISLLSTDIVNGHTEAELAVLNYKPITLLDGGSVTGLHEYIRNFAQTYGMDALIGTDDVNLYYDSFVSYLDSLEEVPFSPILKITFSSKLNLSSFNARKRMFLLNSSYICGSEALEQDHALYPLYSSRIDISFPLQAKLKNDDDGNFNYYTYFRVNGTLGAGKLNLVEMESDLCFRISLSTYGRTFNSNVIVIQSSRIKSGSS